MAELISEVETFKTPFEWCVQHNVRPYNPDKWGEGSNEFSFGHFHETQLTEIEFLARLGDIKFKKNSRPRKMDEFLELRMYGMVIYQLMGIQQGIQFQHAVTTYQRYLQTMPEHRGEASNNRTRGELNERYGLWADKWMTSMVLNGGTSNDSEQYVGTMQQHLKALKDNDVFVMDFREPDLGNCLTALCFMVDERVFDKVTYPEFKNSPYPWDSDHEPNEATFKKWEDDNARNKERWVEKVGGPENAFLREFLIGKRLA